MRWIFIAQLKPFVLLAGAASLMLNLALLMPSIYMMQVFDRVFASRSVETLVMLSALVFLALALGYCMDVVRSRALSWSGRALDRRLSPGGRVLPSIRVQIDYSVKLLAPAIGDRFVGRGEVISAGKSLIVARADAFALSDRGEVQVATGLVTMRVIS